MANLPPSLKAHQFQEDPRLAQAEKLILEALLDHQKSFTSIKAPDPSLEQSYQEMLESFSHYRGGKLYFPYIGSGFGKGALVELLDGSVKYDLISGIGPHYWGHHHPDLVKSSLEAALSDTVMQGHLQQTVDVIPLSELLIQASGLDHCFLSSSGAMANENAIKLALQKKSPASRLLAFEKCFIGRTWALSQITDKPSFREGIPLNIFVDYIPFYDPKRPQESIVEAVQTLNKYIQRYPHQYAGMCFELVQGEGGFNVGTTPFFSALMEVLKEHDIPIIVDEVQTFGRTSALFAYQHFQLERFVDIVSIGKLSQVCATLFRKDFRPRPGLLSQTFTGSTASIKAALVIISNLLQGSYFGPSGKIIQLHNRFVSHFEELEKRYPDRFSGPYGIGTMLAFTPLQGDPQKVGHFVQELFKAGIISFVAGSNPMRVRFLPSIGTLSDPDIDAIRNILEEVLKKN